MAEANERNEQAERAIRVAFDAGDHERAATLVIEHYGLEILGFLVARLGHPDEASEVFGDFSEQFWKTLPGFEWRCSARTWAYKLARRAAGHHLEGARRRRAHHVPLSQESRLSRAVARVRTTTLAHMRTEVKDRFQALRDSLPQEDQTLLILRIDRKMSWNDLAEVMLLEGTANDEVTLQKEAARLRKRFQLVKERLRGMAQREGLFDGDR